LSSYPTRIAELYEEWVTLQKSLRGERERANALSSQLRQPRKEAKEVLIKEAKELKEQLAAEEKKESEIEQNMKNLALQLPNSTHPTVPVGTEARVLGYINENLAEEMRIKGKEEGRSHIQIGAELKLLDFSDAGRVSGWGWYYLLNEAVLLEQALISYALSLAAKLGWRLVTPPNVVYSHMAAACGFRPRDQNGEQQMYLLNDGKHALAGTAEIPLAGMRANSTFGAEDLPVKVVGVGRAYRAEAGARGVEGKGLYRVHEFTKVELFAWAPPPELHVVKKGRESAATFPEMHYENESKATADGIFEGMLEFQKSFISSLGIYARVLEMPTADLGASASRKIDIEAYMPSRAGRDPWGEVSSLSNCTDYQSRRLNTRVKLEGGSGKRTSFPYTLNGTACAVPRVLIAILENGWCEKQAGVVVPEVLRPFMGGIGFIGKK
jgi:seryl-tRNA synthetase